MDIGRNRSLVTMGADKTLVHINASPYVIVCVGSTNLNVGFILSLADEMSSVVAALASA